MNTLLLILRSLLFYSGFVVITLVQGVICLPIALPLSLDQRYRVISSWAYIILWWLKTTCNIHFRVEGLGNIPKKNMVILAKHQSPLETFFLHTLFRPQSVVLKKELLYIPIFGWALSLIGTIQVDRSNKASSLKQLIKQGRAALDRGRWITVYPEGTRIPPGTTETFNIGGALLAEKAGYDVLPVTHNAGLHWPSQKLIKYPGTVTVIIGKPIRTAGRRSKDINQEAEQWVRKHSLELEQRHPNKHL